MTLGYPGKNSAALKVGSVICLKRATKYFLDGVRNIMRQVIKFMIK